jgi:hypothetical protein
MYRAHKLVFSLALAILAPACGDSDPSRDGTGSTGGASSTGGTSSTGGQTASPIGDLLPWKEGNSWKYRVTDDDATVTTKTTTVGPLELVGGTGPNKDLMAHRVTTHKDDTGGGTEVDETVSWQAVVGQRVVRYREQAFGRMTNLLELEEHWDPSKLHVDSSAANTTVGHDWLESYTETKLPAGGEPTYNSPSFDRWFVDAREMVTVPGGTFDALVLRKVSSSQNEKRYWYAPGVGKVKETGGQTEELVEYNLN